MKVFKILATATLALSISTSTLALDAQPSNQLPVSFQVVIYKKVMERYFPSVDHQKLQVVYNDQTEALSKRLTGEFTIVGVDAVAVHEDQLEQGEKSIYFLTPGLAKTTTEKLQTSGQLVITSEQDVVAQGGASLGMVIKAGRPNLLAHVGNLQATGLEIEPALFAMANVVDRQ